MFKEIMSIEDTNQFMNDKEIAHMLSVSPSWVRKQRHLLNKGEDHIFKVEPIYIGSSPRYSTSAVTKWIGELLSR